MLFNPCTKGGIMMVSCIVDTSMFARKRDESRESIVLNSYIFSPVF